MWGACAFFAEQVCNLVLRLRFSRKPGSQSRGALVRPLTSGFAILLCARRASAIPDQRVRNPATSMRVP